MLNESVRSSRIADLIEVGCREARLIRALHHAACIDAVDAAAVVRVETQGCVRQGVNAGCPFPATAPPNERRYRWVHPIRTP